MRGLALEGGGAKGAYQAGAIKALNERKIKFDGVAGTSIGAINAAFYASNNSALLYKLWMSTDSKEIFGIESNLIDSMSSKKISLENMKIGIDSIFKVIKNRGIDISNIRSALYKNIDEEKIRKSNINYGLVTFNISDMKPVEIFIKDIQKGKLIDYIIASAYLPCFKFEKIIDDKYYLDGGVYANCPINMFIENNYEEIYAIKAWENNKIKYKKKTGVKVIVISPKEPLGSILSFSPKTAKMKMNYGYYDTLKELDNLDGNGYYFKKYSEKYYSNLFDIKKMKYMHKKYGNILSIKSDKKFIIEIIEKICTELKIKKFKIYNMPYLLVKLKYIMVVHKKNKYSEFIKEIKVIF